ELYKAGVLGALFPSTVFARRSAGLADRAEEPRAFAAIECLEQLLSDSSLAGERFGSMLREINAPEIVVLALLLHDNRLEREPADTQVAVPEVPAMLRLDGEATRKVDFLIRHQLD